MTDYAKQQAAHHVQHNKPPQNLHTQPDSIRKAYEASYDYHKKQGS